MSYNVDNRYKTLHLRRITQWGAINRLWALISRLVKRDRGMTMSFCPEDRLTGNNPDPTRSID